MNVSVIEFPGSNCNIDMVKALEFNLGLKVKRIWHTESSLENTDIIFLPGGFSFGDYLRSGALATLSPVMKEIKRLAQKKIPIMGVCNGFQILTESRLLPGALLPNKSSKFLCRYVNLQATSTFFSKEKNSISLPIAHGEGRFFIDEIGLKNLMDNDQVAFKYSEIEEDGLCCNGSLSEIAGIFSKDKKILGLMPHPERAMREIVGGSSDGVFVFKEFLKQAF